MSFLSGVAKAIQEKDDKDHQVFMQNEQFKNRRKEMLMDLAAKRGGVFSDSSGSSGSKRGASSGAQMTANAKLLLKEGLPEETVAQLMATKNPEVLDTVVEEFNKNKEVWQSSNRTQGMDPDAINEFVSRLVIEGATENKLDKDFLKNNFGVTEEEFKEYGLQGTTVSRGAVSVQQRTAFEPMKASETAAWRANYGTELVDELSVEQAKAKKLMAALDQVSKTDRTTYMDDTYRYLLDRSMRISEALDTFKETKAPAVLAQVLGTNEFAKKFFEYQPRLEDNPSFDSLKEVQAETAGNIDNLNVVTFLAEKGREGLVKPGFLFKHKGKITVYVPDGEEGAKWLSSKGSDLDPSNYVFYNGEVRPVTEFY